jgi:hypothetical protein
MRYLCVVATAERWKNDAFYHTADTTGILSLPLLALVHRLLFKLSHVMSFKRNRCSPIFKYSSFGPFERVDKERYHNYNKHSNRQILVLLLYCNFHTHRNIDMHLLACLPLFHVRIPDMKL